MTLKVEGLVRRIADFELRADFSIQAHERVALRGRSGSGKSSLLRALAGLDPIQGGRIWLGDAEITQRAAERRGIGFVFQDAALFPAMSVLENVGFGLEMKGAPRPERERAARELLTAVGLVDQAASNVDRLSGGEKSRVALARAFASRPRLVLLDEPFAALDEATGDQVRALVVRLHVDHPVPLLLVSHDAQDIERVATRVLDLKESVGIREIRE